MDSGDGVAIFVITVFAMLIGLVIGASISDRMTISQETLNDICKNLSGNNISVGSVEHGKLICEIPSYDSTTNIVVRKTGEEK